MTELLSGRQAANRLGVSHMTVLRWVQDGKLVPVGRTGKDGKQLLFEGEYIERKATERRSQKAQKATA